jgi:hypothetical protein
MRGSSQCWMLKAASNKIGQTLVVIVWNLGDTMSATHQAVQGGSGWTRLLGIDTLRITPV